MSTGQSVLVSGYPCGLPAVRPPMVNLRAVCWLSAVAIHLYVLFCWSAEIRQGVAYAMGAGQTVEVSLVAGPSPGAPAVAAATPAAAEPVQEEPEPTEKVATPPVPKPDFVIPKKTSKPKPVHRKVAPAAAQTTAAPASSGPASGSEAPSNGAPGGGVANGPAAGAGSGGPSRAVPDYLVNPPPPYPPLSRRRGEQGVVLVNVAIDESGKVADLSVKQSSGFTRLDEAAVTAIKRWKFKPAMVAGIRVADRVDVPIRFTLRQ